MVIRLKKRVVAIFALCFVLVTALLVFGAMQRSEQTTASAAAQVGENERLLPVIMYHQLTDTASNAGPYVLTSQQFEADMRYIKSKGYTSVTTQQLIDYGNQKASLPEKPILITFDDGYESFINYAQPILNELDMYAVVSIIGSVAQTYTDTSDHTIRYSHLSWEAIGQLSQDPHVEIGNHTYNLHTLDQGRRGCAIKSGEEVGAYKTMLTADLTKTQDLIAKYTGSPAKTFAYPFGAKCSQSEEVLRDMGFQVVLTCAEKINHITDQSTDWLYQIGRFNRPSGKTSEQFFQKILV